MQHLIVVRPFGSYRVGDLVSDAAAIAAIISSEHAGHVVRINPAQEI